MQTTCLWKSRNCANKLSNYQSDRNQLFLFFSLSCFQFGFSLTSETCVCHAWMQTTVLLATGLGMVGGGANIVQSRIGFCGLRLLTIDFDFDQFLIPWVSKAAASLTFYWPSDNHEYIHVMYYSVFYHFYSIYLLLMLETRFSISVK